MTDDRLMIAQAVFEGKISEDYLTQDEVDEMFEMVADEVFNQELVKAQDRGCNVFSGFEDDLIH